MKFTVRDDDIWNGRKQCKWECPIALALLREVPGAAEVSVTPERVSVYSYEDGQGIEDYQPSNSMRDFMAFFDYEYDRNSLVIMPEEDRTFEMEKL